ncbi:thiolase family protein [Pseudonocardia endophytica]|uniref:propanoyl-CoA C-acyltransferase n=1 Tax=Pseudonocardia endophytica TaxID=401976 RepID=A0A4V2PIY0_PSEEN|nr:thiolase family protein [Pseudonocardia endophytica]TCK26356.1 acetyl-CoA acetyltransferase [Pseudonocardia endophytica]
MRQVDIVGVGITPFGKHEDATLAPLGAAAVGAALDDAGIEPTGVDLLVHGNAMAGLVTGQEMIRGQVVAAAAGLAGVPVLNTENACATSSSALHVAVAGVRSGMYETVVVCGTEKMTGRPTRQVLDAMTTGTDIDRIPAITRELTGRDEPAESFYMEVYARITRQYMERSGATAHDLAEVAAKNSAHGALNPNAQYRQARSVEEILAGRVVADPLTMLMCSPIADGAAALVVRAADRPLPGADAEGARVRVLASALLSGIPGTAGELLEARTATLAYGQAGIGPEDLDVVEVHDAASPNELIMYEELGLCGHGEGPKLLATGATRLGGRVPVNPDGGLVSRGHPVGATGCAQVVELVTQLRGRAGDRQVPGARHGLAENAGGYVHPDAAACAVTILGRQ